MISGAYVVVEVDGRTHEGEKAQQYDRSRETYMRNIGFTTLRFSNTEVMRDTANVIAKIMQSCTLTEAGNDNTLIVKCPAGNAKYSGRFIDYSLPRKKKAIKTALSSCASVRVCNRA